MKFFNAGNVSIIIALLLIAYALYSYFSHWIFLPIKTANNIRIIPTIDEKLIFSDNKKYPQIKANIGIK